MKLATEFNQLTSYLQAREDEATKSGDEDCGFVLAAILMTIVYSMAKALPPEALEKITFIAHEIEGLTNARVEREQKE